MHKRNSLCSQLTGYLCILFSHISYTNDISDFECSFPLSDGNQSVRSFVLTSDVYQCLLHTQYNDLTIINAEQQFVPWQLTMPEAPDTSRKYKQNIVFYKTPSSVTYKTGNQIRHIAQLTGFASGSETDTQWQAKNVFYSSLILQKEKKSDFLTSITINTAPNNNPISATVIVETSDDLQHWTTVLSPYHLYILPGAKNTLQNSTLTISTHESTIYLRLSALSNIKNFTETILNITGEYVHNEQSQPPLQWLEINELHALDEENTWTFSLPSLLPISRMRFTVPADMVFYQGELYSQAHENPTLKTDKEQTRRQGKEKFKKAIKQAVNDLHHSKNTAINNWRFISNFTQYHIKSETDTSMSTDIYLSVTQSTQWKIKFTQPTKLQLRQLPTIQLGWHAPQITFVAQGSAPFHLLAGNQQSSKQLQLPLQLQSQMKNAENVAILAETKLVNSIETSAEPTNIQKTNWQKIALWSLLFMGLCLIGAMVYTLSVKMNATQKEQ